MASIKPSGPQSVRGTSGGPGTSDPGQYSFGRATLLDLIAQAYDVDYFRVTSPVSLDQQRFDLVAKLPAGATKDEFRGMLRVLLAERFHLKAHTVSKEYPLLELTVGKDGPKLKEAGPPAAGRPHLTWTQSFDRGFTLAHVRAERSTMALLAKMIPQSDAPAIVDKTGLTGSYDFTLDYTIYSPPPGPEGPPAAPPPPELAAALREQLGLLLVRTKGPLDMVVIESVDKLPTEN